MRTLWIDGGWQSSAGGTLRQIINPATLEFVDEVAEATATDVTRACEAASRASRHWARLPALERG
jgi:acyl-CoA reductase-like NAD-dependent aldehyde dehydrogenase